MSRKPLRERKRPGFTLVEILVAAAILGVCLLFIMTAFVPGYRDVAYAGRVSQSVMLAQQKLEQLKAGSFPPVTGTETNGIYALTWAVTSVGVGPATGDLRKISITVTWPQSTRPGRYDLVGFTSKPY
jgi:prepilin-type N-terminal cleavage/methylation domain-containing protein